MSIGNVKSNERGSGARFNDGKVPLELIPVELLQYFRSERPLSEHDILDKLGLWQEGELYAYEILDKLSLEDAEDAARVFAYGARKYAAWNWIKGMPWSVPLGCALRHIFAIRRGEDIDPESGLSHRGHLVCNLIMLAQFERTYTEGDDRPIQWLSTGEEDRPTGGPDFQEEDGSQPEPKIDPPQNTLYDPPYGRHNDPPPVNRLTVGDVLRKRYNSTSWKDSPF